MNGENFDSTEYLNHLRDSFFKAFKARKGGYSCEEVLRISISTVRWKFYKADVTYELWILTRVLWMVERDFKTGGSYSHAFIKVRMKYIFGILHGEFHRKFLAQLKMKF